jgi:hypothetical protein
MNSSKSVPVAAMVPLSLVPVALSSVVLVLHHMRQSELRIRRALLELEFRLASQQPQLPR